MMARENRYTRLNGKFLRDAEALLARGDAVQASEKLWGAAAAAVKAVALSRGRNLRSHGDLWKFVEALDAKHPRLRIYEDFADASHLHSNFYEDELRLRVVQIRARSVKRLVHNLLRLAQ